MSLVQIPFYYVHGQENWHNGETQILLSDRSEKMYITNDPVDNDQKATFLYSWHSSSNSKIQRLAEIDLSMSAVLKCWKSPEKCNSPSCPGLPMKLYPVIV